MSINSLSSVQSIINKKSASSLPPGVTLITSLSAPAVFSPFYYWDTNKMTTTLSANGVVIGATCIGENQTAP